MPPRMMPILDSKLLKLLFKPVLLLSSYLAYVTFVYEAFVHLDN